MDWQKFNSTHFLQIVDKINKLYKIEHLLYVKLPKESYVKHKSDITVTNENVHEYYHGDTIRSLCCQYLKEIEDIDINSTCHMSVYKENGYSIYCSHEWIDFGDNVYIPSPRAWFTEKYDFEIFNVVPPMFYGKKSEFYKMTENIWKLLDSKDIKLKYKQDKELIGETFEIWEGSRKPFNFQ